MNDRSLSTLCLLMAGLLALGACGNKESTTEEVFLPSVSAALIEKVDLEEEIRASGDLRARLHTTIAAEVEGRITEVAVDEGLAVEAGAVVLEIDPDRRRLEYDASQAQLAQARAQYRKEKRQTARMRKLNSQNISSQQQLDEAETALELAASRVAASKADLGVAERALANASVRAPFAGVVARRSVQLGEFVQPGKSLVELVAMDPLEAVFSLTELDTERVKTGQLVDLRVGAFPKRVFQGRVTFVAPTVDPLTRTLRIKAEVDNPDGALRPGLFTRVSLGIERRSGVLMVPEEALVQRADGAYLFRIGAENRVERVAVQTGASERGRVEVRGPVRAGERIVRRGHGGLADGAVVTVRDGIQAPVVARDEATDADENAKAEL